MNYNGYSGTSADFWTDDDRAWPSNHFAWQTANHGV